MSSDPGLFLVHVSLHGLVRGSSLELGCNADTGGQVKFVIELARQCTSDQRVDQVLVVTRRIEDDCYSVDYALPEEQLEPKLRIARIDFGPRGYVPKESLWPHLDEAADRLLALLQSYPHLPDVLHAHYADAAYVCTRVSTALGIPMVLTTHSLGKLKRGRLLAQGHDEAQIEELFAMRMREEAEEQGFEHSAVVFTSTEHERDQQCGLYDAFRHEKARVLAPGVHLPLPLNGDVPGGLVANVERFLREPSKPPLLMVARPALSKNAVALVRAFGESLELQQSANLVLVLGGAQCLSLRVLTQVLLAIDKWDLYGAVAYPKSHTAGEVRQLYSWAMARKGALVNPALAEPFGLTLLEAASCGLPVVATNCGGPVDIVKQLQNGQLVDVNEPRQLVSALSRAVTDGELWEEWSASGVRNIGKFSWEAHVEAYLRVVEALERRPVVKPLKPLKPECGGLAMFDLDHTLIGASGQLPALLLKLDELKQSHMYQLGVCTGRSFENASALLDSHHVPWDMLVSICVDAALLRATQVVAGGTELHWKSDQEDSRQDGHYSARMKLDWDRERVSTVLSRVAGLVPQPDCEQTEFKICFYITEHAPSAASIQSLLRQQRLKARVVCTRHRFLDVLPMRASKGMALRYICGELDISIGAAVTAGDSSEDFDMLIGCTQGIVVGNYDHDELEGLKDSRNVFFARNSDAGGILEGLAHYGL